MSHSDSQIKKQCHRAKTNINRIKYVFDEKSLDEHCLRKNRRDFRHVECLYLKTLSTQHGLLF